MTDPLDGDGYRRMFTRDGSNSAGIVSYPVTFGDHRPAIRYVVSPDVELAVNVALATGRPLLVLGAPGSGKTSLGFAVAERLGWDVYDTVVTTRTRAQDLLWTFDNVRRLSNALSASSAAAGGDEAYIGPGVLWWALDPCWAARISAAQQRDVPAAFSVGAVVVIDEIDKADPGLPNDLLRPLGDLEFDVIDLAHQKVVRRRERPPLVFVTSNGERTLPAAFLRRCVVLKLPSFDRARLLEIAAQHFPNSTSKDRAAVLDELVKLVPTEASGLPAIGTAEYLDVLRACLELDVRPGDRHWDQVSGAALVKRPIRER